MTDWVFRLRALLGRSGGLVGGQQGQGMTGQRADGGSARGRVGAGTLMLWGYYALRRMQGTYWRCVM